MLRSEVGHVRGHAGAGHHHGDGADGASFRAQAVADALVSIHDDGFTGDHRQHVAFRANAGTRAAADAVIRVDVGMLGLGSIGKQLPFFDRFASESVTLLQASKIAGDKEETNEGGDRKCDECVHAMKSEVPHGELQSNVQQCENGKSVAERFMNDVPEVKNSLRAGEEQNALG